MTQSNFLWVIDLIQENLNSLIIILLSTVSVVPMSVHQVGEGLLLHCSATHPSRTTKPKIRILGVVVREGCVALHYSVDFFLRFFLFHVTIVIEGDGIGARSVRFPHRYCVCPTRSRKIGIRTQGHAYVCRWLSRIHMVLSSYPSFSRAGRQTHKIGGNRIDLAPLPSPSITIVA